jgi:hypothetical protein
MNLHDLLQLPPEAAALFALMIWPAAWAAGLAIVALGRDLERIRDRRHTVKSEKTYDVEERAH